MQSKLKNPIGKKPVTREGAITLTILFFLICGLLLTIKPGLMIDVITIALSVCMLLSGIQKTFAYFKQSVEESRQNFDLAIGLSLACFGLLLLLKREIIQSILPVLLGMMMMVGGFSKAQLAFDLYRVGDKRWWYFLIGVAVSVVLGILSLAVPNLSLEGGTRYAGISLLVEAAIDTAALVFSHIALQPKDKPADAKPAPKKETAPEQPTKDAKA